VTDPEHRHHPSLAHHLDTCIKTGAATLDIFPTAYEVTQVIDYGPVMLDSRNTLCPDTYYCGPVTFGEFPPLIEGKDTLIRVYGAASGTGGPQAAVPALAYVKPRTCPTPPCEYIPELFTIPPIFSPGNVKPQGITVPVAGGPGSLPADLVGNAGASWNFFIPAHLARGDLSMTIFVNEGAYAAPVRVQPEKQECATCGSNNDLELRLYFRTQADMTISPVFLTLDGTGAVADEKKRIPAYAGRGAPPVSAPHQSRDAARPHRRRQHQF
jgi:hypothetical protein